MIQINLVPEAERGGKTTRPTKASSPGGGGASAVIFLLTVAIAALVGGSGFVSWTSVHAVKSEYKKAAKEKAALDAEIASMADKAEEIRMMRDILTNQWEVLQSLDPPNRILWSEKVNMLANLMPEEIFLTEIGVREQVVEVEIDSSIKARQDWEENGKKGAPPEVVKKPVISYDLSLTGLATGPNNVEQFNNIIRFHDALTAHDSVDAWGTKRRFMDNFNPTVEFVSAEATLYEGVPVHQFIFKLRTQPMGAEKPSTDPVLTAQANRERGERS